jgi:hypothetical protein
VDDKDRKDQKRSNVVKLFRDAMTDATPKGPPKPRKAPRIDVSGSHNLVAGGDIHIVTATPARGATKVVRTDQPGTLSPAQRSDLQKLVQDWVALHAVVRRGAPLTHQAAWASLNRSRRVASYHEIPAEDFPKAVAWVQRQMAILNATPTAMKRAPTWRAARITAIQTRTKQLDLDGWRRQYMREHFGAASLTEMTDAQIEQLYRALMGK